MFCQFDFNFGILVLKFQFYSQRCKRVTLNSLQNAGAVCDHQLEKEVLTGDCCRAQ